MHIFQTFIATLCSFLVVATTSHNPLPAGSPPDAHHRLLTSARRLNDEDDAIDFSWVSDYSIQFHSCHRTMEFRADGGSGDNEDGDDASPMEIVQLIQFKLCPSARKCSRNCNRGADYVVEMREFLESYMEMKEDELEYQCEAVENSCYCNDDNVDEDTCLQNCYTEAGLEGCGGDDNNDDDFELDRYLECRALNEDDDSNNKLYVGAYCSGNGIYLGTFTDRQCTKKANANAYQSYTGYALPYSSTSMLSKDCMSCKEPAENDGDNNNENNGNDDQYDADEVKEACEELYERSAKCERKLQGVDEQNSGGCEFIYKLLPQVERIANHSVAPSRVFAWIFFMSTVGLAAFAATLWKKLNPNSGMRANLLHRGGVAA